MQPGVFSLVDDTHAPAAELFQDAKVADDTANHGRNLFRANVRPRVRTSQGHARLRSLRQPGRSIREGSRREEGSSRPNLRAKSLNATTVGNSPCIQAKTLIPPEKLQGGLSDVPPDLRHVWRRDGRTLVGSPHIPSRRWNLVRTATMACVNMRSTRASHAHSFFNLADLIAGSPNE